MLFANLDVIDAGVEELKAIVNSLYIRFVWREDNAHLESKVG